MHLQINKRETAVAYKIITSTGQLVLNVMFIQDRIGLSIAELVAGHADQCSFLAVQSKVEHRVQSVTC